METQKLKSMLHLISMLFVITVVMMSANHYGMNTMVLLLAFALFQLIPMTFLQLDNYVSEKGKFQYPVGIPGGAMTLGLSNMAKKTAMSFDDLDTSGKIEDIVVTLIMTVIMIAYCVKSGIFQTPNLNPMKMFK
jgi:hypothetical protein